MAGTSNSFAGQTASELCSNVVQQLMTIAKMTQAIENLPDSKNLRKRLTNSLAQLGIPQQLLNRVSGEVHDENTAIEPFDITPIVTFALLKSTRTLIDQHKYQTAQGFMGAFIGHFPESAEAHYLLARAEFGIGHDELAETLFERAIALDTRRLESYYGLATLYERLGKYEIAEKTWRRGFEFGAIFHRPYQGSGKPRARILVITSVLSGNMRFMRFSTPTNLILPRSSPSRTRLI